MGLLLSGRLVCAGNVDEGWVELGGGAVAAAGAGPPPRVADMRHEGLIAPGLCDLQVNGAAGVEVTGGTAALVAIEGALLAHGVTSCLATIVTTDDATADEALAALAPRIADPGSPFAGAHLEGPYLAPGRRGVHRAELLRVPSDGTEPAAYAHPAVRLVTLAPELPGALDLVERLAGRGVAVSLGHSAAPPAVAAAALGRGATLVTHLFNGMPPFHHRDPGLAGWALLEPRIGLGLIADGVHVDDAALALVSRAAAERILLVSDASPAAAAPPGRFTLAGVPVTGTADGRSLTADGAPAGAGVLLDGVVRHWARAAGTALPEALAAASERPAAAVGLRAGLAPGDPADLLLLDEDGALVRVMKAGRWVA